MKEYVITHLHTMNSNSILADSPSKLEDYLKEIKNKDGIRGIIRTEHGHCQNWFKTYQLMEKWESHLWWLFYRKFLSFNNLLNDV